MRRAVILLLVVMLLGGGLVGTALAGYSGLGLVWPGGPSARVGSIGGPVIIGGPGSGK